MKKDDEPEDEGSGYNWMDTYGDLVTLLLCFFVLLYSFSSLNQEKWEELVSAFSGSYGASAIQAFDISSVREEPINIDSMVNMASRDNEAQNDPATQEDQQMTAQQAQEQQEQINDTFDALYEKVLSFVELNGLEDIIGVTRTDDYIILRFNEIALFDSGSADIRPESEETLNYLIAIIADNIDALEMVDIEGHTDNVPISTAEFHDNWDLSVKRATNTLRILLASGLIDVTKLSVNGYGEYHPIATNETPEGRALNRRVDFVLNKINVTGSSG